MDSDLQRSSSHPLASTIRFVDETSGLTGQLGPFHLEPQSFAPFRTIDNVPSRQPSQNATQAQRAIALGNNAQATSNDGMSLLQSAGQTFQQPNYRGLAPDAEASTSFAGQLQGMKLDPDPPDLDYWRDRLFRVDETITLSEEQYVIICCCSSSLLVKHHS